MPASPFVHLHVHSHYSLLDGATRIEAMIARAKQWNMPSLAITDHGNLFGAVEFYNAARKAGIKPIIGCEAYLATGDRRHKEPVEGKEMYHLLLLAMNREGYQNLVRLSTIAYTEGFYRKPRIDKEVLREFSSGLLCTSTCIGGEIPQTFMNRDRAAAEDLAKTYLEIFGPDRFFMEIQDHQMPEQKTLNPELLDMARRLGVATIATNDVHYLDHADYEAHDVLCCINTGKQINDEGRFKFPTDQFYFKSPEEMAALFPDAPEALTNTLRVADLCNLELDLGKRYAPVYRVPAEIVDDDAKSLDDNAYLRRLVYEGADKRYREITPELRERIEYELGVITGKGFASYFLIVWDCVRFARANNIPVGARGSGCSSVVSFCLYISSPDPIRYGLYFERFLDPDRDEMPDIDLDICQNGRAAILDYVRNKYGHVAQIITFGTLKPKAAVKDVARVLGLGFTEANELTKLIPAELHITLDKAIAQEPELKKKYESDPKIKRIIDIARRLEGVARNSGVHAAGVVVADQALVNFLPLCKASSGDIITQFDGPSIEQVGLLKMDFLGLRTLTTLERARELAEQSTSQPLDLDSLDLTDQTVYSLFGRGETKGIFQFESGGMRDVVMRMKPNRIEDLIAANALFRPGPMEYIPDYVSRKHGTPWTTPHPIMTEVLSETYGIMVYQEQVSRLVNRLGGLELKAAFRLAKAISKKKTSMIEAMREPFLAGCEKNGVTRDTAQQVFEDILKFGGYAFNKAHSTGYALIAYQTAWMKTYYPVEFMAALMTFEMVSTEKIGEYREECRTMHIGVEPPDINTSLFDFVVETAHASSLTKGGLRGVDQTDISEPRSSDRADPRTSMTSSILDNPRGQKSAARETFLQSPDRSTIDNSANGHSKRIVFGLGAIKGVGQKAVAAIVNQRKTAGPYRNLFDFCERTDLGIVNRGTIEALICAGAFDKTGQMRRALFESIDRAMTVGQSAQRDRKRGQNSLFGLADEPPVAVETAPLPGAEWTEAEMLAKEKAVLGFYITKHPLAHHEQFINACSNAAITDVTQMKEGQKVVIGGMVSSIRTVMSKTGRNAGKPLGVLTLEDLTGRIEGLLFTDRFSEFRPLLLPDAIVFVEAEVDRKREEPSLRVSRVVSLAEAPQNFASAILIDVGDETPLEQLIRLFRNHKGPSRVYLNVTTPDGFLVQVETHESLRVSCSNRFLGELYGLVPRDSLRLLGPTRKAIPLPNGHVTSASVAV